MAAGQLLHGLVGQGLNGRKPNALMQTPYVFTHLTAGGARAWSVPRVGYWKFVAWGPGAPANNGINGGASGAYVEVMRFLTPSQNVTIQVGLSVPKIDTVLTFPDGTIATAGAASANGPGGLAAGGDINLGGTAGVIAGGINGNPGLGTGGGPGGAAVGANSGGAGAPANLPFIGGQGGSSGAAAIGAGAPESNGGIPGQGLVVAFFVKK